MSFFNKSLPFYIKLKDYEKIGEAYEYIASLHDYLGDYSKSHFFSEKSLQAYANSKNSKKIATTLIVLGVVNYKIGNFSKSIEYYLKSLPVAEGLKNKEMLGDVYINIGGIYSKLKEFRKTLAYYDKATVLFKELNDERNIAKTKLEIGYILLQQGKVKETLKNYTEALNQAEKGVDRGLEIEILYNLGEYYTSESDYKKSVFYYNQCLELAKKNNNIQYKGQARIALGKVLLNTKQYKIASEKCNVGLKYAIQLKALAIQEEACDCLYKSYKALGKNQLALRFYEKSIALNDSLKLEETSNKMMNMEFQKQQLIDSLSFVKKQHMVELKHKEEVQRKEKQRNYIIATLCLMMLVAGGLWSSLNFVRKSRAALKIEKDRSEELLLNILPEEIAEELKEKGSVNTQEHNLVSILFTDFKSFTQTAANMTPKNLVEEINVCFKAFDLIVEKYQIEKIKTIGDAYMAAGGLPHPFEHSFKNVLLAGLEMQEFITKRVAENKQNNIPAFEMRLGIHAGPIVAGIVGVKKFQYDVWGDTVNTASRMESNCEVGRVNISETLYDIVKDYPEFDFEYRGEIAAKGKGDVKMYFVNLKTQA
jgi:adenylate cyclase